MSAPGDAAPPLAPQPPDQPLPECGQRGERGAGAARGCPPGASLAPAPSRKNSIESKTGAAPPRGGSRACQRRGPEPRRTCACLPPGAPFPRGRPELHSGAAAGRVPDAPRVAAPPPPPLVRAPRRLQLPLGPPDAAAAAAGPHLRQRDRGERAGVGGQCGAPAPRARFSTAPSSSPAAARAARPPRCRPCACGAAGSAPRRGGRGDGEGAGRGALQLGWPGSTPLAPPRRERNFGAGAGGGGPRRLPGAAEPLRSPTPPLLRPPRPARPRGAAIWGAGVGGTRDAAGEGLSRDTCRFILGVPPMGSQLRPSVKRPSEDQPSQPAPAPGSRRRSRVAPPPAGCPPWDGGGGGG